MDDDDVTRRGFLAGTAGATAVAAVGAAAAVSGTQPAAAASDRTGPGRLPAPGDSGIDHIVVVMMENRSFDQFNEPDMTIHGIA